MDDDAYATVAKFRTLTYMGLVRDLAVVDKEDEQRDELWEKGHVVEVEPACYAIKINGVEHELEINE